MINSEVLAELVKQFQSYPDNELLDMAASPNWALSTHQAVREVLKARGVAAPPLPPPPEKGWAEPVYPVVERDAEPPTATVQAAGPGRGKLSAAELANRPLARASQALKTEELSPRATEIDQVERHGSIGPNFWAGRSVQLLCDRFPPTLGAAEIDCIHEFVPSWNSGGPAAKEALNTAADRQLASPVDSESVLRASSEAVSRGDRGGLERAKSNLLALLAGQPDLGEAREVLGLAQLRLREFKDAIETYATLAKAAPDRALHQLRWGFALHGDEQLEEAATRYRRAMNLDPADLEAHLAWVDLQVDLEQYDKALTALGQVATRGARSDGDPDVQRRKLEILLVSGRLEEAWKELERIRGALAGKDTTALRAWSFALRALLPAKLLARGCASQANDLLQRLQWLGAGGARLHASGHSLELAALPRATRDWLTPSGAAVRVSHDGQVRIGPALLLPAVFWGFALLWALAGEERWGVGGIILTSALIGVAALVTAAVARVAWRVIGSGYGSFMVLHPLYLIRGNYDRVSLWPCVAFEGAVVRSAGVGPQSSVAEIQFANGSPRPDAVRLLSASPNESLARLMAIDGLRRWALGRIATGSLEKEEVARQFPVDVVQERKTNRVPNPLWLARTLAWYCGALVLAVPLVSVSVRHNRSMADQAEREATNPWEERHAAGTQRWRDLQAHPTLKAYRAYLEQPDGRHQADASVLAIELRHQLERQLATRPAKARPILLFMVNAMLDGASAEICLDYRVENYKATQEEHGQAFQAFSGAIRHSISPLKMLQAAVDETFGQDQIEVVRCHGTGQIAVVLSAEAVPTGEVYALEAKDGFELPAMVVDWSVAVRLPGSEEPVVRGDGLIEPPPRFDVWLLHRAIENYHRLEPRSMSEDDLRAALATARVRSRDLAYQRMADFMAQQAVRAAAIELGLGEPQLITESAGPADEVFSLTRSPRRARGRSQ